MQRKLSLATLGALDGGAARAIIDAAIATAVEDLDDRGEDEKPRLVNIVITVSRKRDNPFVECHVEAEARLPKRRTGNHITQIKRDGEQTELTFQEFDSADPTQRTIDELENRPAAE